MSNGQTQLNVAVVGVGRMGTHHARTYHNLETANLVAVADVDLDRAKAVAAKYGATACSGVEDLLTRFPDLHAVSVAVPTVHHRRMAAPLLERGIGCLVEKPLAGTVDEARALANLAGKHQAVLQVGHTERFNPAVRAIAGMNLRPRFIEIVRVSPMTFRSLDVSVVMDMMIHDLDIVLMLEPSPLVRVEAVGMPILSRTEDLANARLHFASGCVANLTASRMALQTERRMRLFSDQAFVNLDFQHRTGTVVRLSDHSASLADIRARLEAGEDLSSLPYADMVQVEELRMDLPEGHNDPLTAQLSSFLDAVRHGGTPVVDGRAGYAAVEAAARVVAAIGDHEWIDLPAALT